MGNRSWSMFLRRVMAGSLGLLGLLPGGAAKAEVTPPYGNCGTSNSGQTCAGLCGTPPVVGTIGETDYECNGQPGTCGCVPVFVPYDGLAMAPTSAVLTVQCGNLSVAPNKGGTLPAEAFTCPDINFDPAHPNSNPPYTVDLYSNGALIYTEHNPILIVNKDNGNKTGFVSVILTGNGNSADFASSYEGATSWLNRPNLLVRIWTPSGDPAKPEDTILLAPYQPQGGALWSLRSDDGTAAQAAVAAETARAEAAEASLGAQIDTSQALAATIAKLESQLSALQAQVTALQAQVTTAQAQTGP